MRDYLPIAISVLALGVSVVALVGQQKTATETSEREELVAQINNCVTLSAHHFKVQDDGGELGGKYMSRARSLGFCLSDEDLASCRARENSGDQLC